MTDTQENHAHRLALKAAPDIISALATIFPGRSPPAATRAAACTSRQSAAGGARIGLDGEIAGEVTPAEFCMGAETTRPARRRSSSSRSPTTAQGQCKNKPG
jgi:hypothetical protein